MRWNRNKQERSPAGQRVERQEKRSGLERLSQFVLAVWLVLFGVWLSARLLSGPSVQMSAMAADIMCLWLGVTGILVVILLLRLLLLSAELWLLQRASRALRAQVRAKRRTERRRSFS